MAGLGGRSVLTLIRWECDEARTARQLSTWSCGNCCACPGAAAIFASDVVDLAFCRCVLSTPQSELQLALPVVHQS